MIDARNRIIVIRRICIGITGYSVTRLMTSLGRHFCSYLESCSKYVVVFWFHFFAVSQKEIDCEGRALPFILQLSVIRTLCEKFPSDVTV